MFILRFLKRLVILVLMIAGVLYIANYQWRGMSIKDHVMSAHKSGLIAEAYKDISTWIGSVFSVGKKMAAEDKITGADKAKLEEVIKNEIQDNVKMLKDKAAEEITGSGSKSQVGGGK